MVSGIRKGSQAEADGLMAGDILVEIEGRTVEDAAFFFETLKRSKDPLKMKVYRNNQYLTVIVHPD